MDLKVPLFNNVDVRCMLPFLVQDLVSFEVNLLHLFGKVFEVESRLFRKARNSLQKPDKLINLFLSHIFERLCEAESVETHEVNYL